MYGSVERQLTPQGKASGMPRTRSSACLPCLMLIIACSAALVYWQPYLPQRIAALSSERRPNIVYILGDDIACVRTQTHATAIEAACAGGTPWAIWAWTCTSPLRLWIRWLTTAFCSRTTIHKRNAPLRALRFSQVCCVGAGLCVTMYNMFCFIVELTHEAQGDTLSVLACSTQMLA
jgi:hypothetical protein